MTGSESAGVSTALTGSKATLDRLPNEVLLEVWVNLHHPGPLARTNKRFRAVSKDVLWRAKWFMQRYARHIVIFVAIDYHVVFSKALLEQLLRLGAPLSRYLAQMLVHVTGRGEETWMMRVDDDISWGSKISRTAYDAVIEQAVRLHGDVSYNFTECDGYVLNQWLQEQHLAIEEAEENGSKHEPAPSESVRRAFRHFNFMPLPFGFEEADENGDEASLKLVYGTDDLSLSLTWDPELTDGFLPRVHDVTNGWAIYFGVDRAKELVEKLKVNGVVRYAPHYAESLVRGLASGMQLHPAFMAGRTAEYELLLHLHSTKSLPFDLQELCDRVQRQVTRERAEEARHEKARRKREQEEAEDEVYWR